jgi:hypothetical protein
VLFSNSRRSVYGSLPSYFEQQVVKHSLAQSKESAFICHLKMAVPLRKIFHGKQQKRQGHGGG